MDKDQFLSLKVMRLSSPNFADNSTIIHVDANSNLQVGKAALESHQLESILSPLNQIQSSNNTHEYALDFLISNALVLPASFGNIYLGETFSSYLCINNDSPLTMQGITFKAELQTSSQRIVLYDTSDNPYPNLITHQTIEFVLSHEIKELGVHILVCTLSYQGPNIERKTFRKFYKFQVLNPLAVKTKVNSLPNGLVFLEAQVQNVTTDCMNIERLKFDPFETFTCQDLSCANELSYISPQDTRQYLFKLVPKSPTASSATGLGKLDIFWRLSMGEMGRLQTSQLVRKALTPDIFDFKVETLPDRLMVERRFTVAFRIKNQVKSTINASVSVMKERMGTMLVYGPSVLQLGLLQPDETLIFQLGFFPLVPGFCLIEGIRITDLNTGMFYDCPPIDAFVYRF